MSTVVMPTGLRLDAAADNALQIAMGVGILAAPMGMWLPRV